MTPEVEAECAAGETGGPACLEAVRQMGRDGWLGIGWPTEYGGQGRTDVEQFIFINESWRAGAPIPFLTINTVGRTIMEFGSEEQKQFFLPKILAGELHFSIGYTEPNAGTDLASLTTQAVKDGDEWVINGQKIYTSLASYADYIWLAARTDPDAPKHAGITIFLVPTTDPGFSYSKISTMVNASTYNTFYDDVRVGDDAVIGELNKGWDLIINQLNYERVSLGPPGMVERVYEEVRPGPRTTKLPDGRRVVDQEWVQLNLARVHAKLEFLKLINWKVGRRRRRQPGRRQRHQGVRHRVLHRGLPAADGGPRPGRLPEPRLERPPCWPAASSGPSRAALILTFGGGVNEVQRDLIALFGAGPAPRARGTEETARWTSPSPTSSRRSPTSPTGSCPSSCPPERLRELEQTETWFADDVWAELAKADLLGSPCPRPTAVAATASSRPAWSPSRSAAPSRRCPYLSSIVRGRPADRRVRQRGAAQAAACPDVIAGAATLTAALYEPSDVAVPAVPTTQATADGDGWRLDGEKSLVVGRRPGRRHPRPGPHRRGRRSACSSSTPTPTASTLERESRPSPASRSGPCASTASPSTPTPCSAVPTRAARDRRLDRRPPGRRHLRHPDRRVRGGARHHRPLRRPSASSSAASSAPSRPSPSAWPTPTSTPRRSASPRCRPRGGWARASTPTTS